MEAQAQWAGKLLQDYQRRVEASGFPGPHCEASQTTKHTPTKKVQSMSEEVIVYVISKLYFFYGGKQNSYTGCCILLSMQLGYCVMKYNKNTHLHELHNWRLCCSSNRTVIKNISVPWPDNQSAYPMCHLFLSDILSFACLHFRWTVESQIELSRGQQELYQSPCRVITEEAAIELHGCQDGWRRHSSGKI